MLTQSHPPHPPGTQTGPEGQMELWWGCIWAPRVLSSGWNHCSGTDAMIKERKTHLQKEGQLEKEKTRRNVNFLDVFLFVRVSLWAEAHRKGYLHSGPASIDGE